MKPAVLVFLVAGTLLRAQVLPPDPEARERPDWGGLRDSLELQRLQLELRKAELALDGTDFWHRLIPRVSLGASFGIRGITFVETRDPEPVVVPTALYRLTVSLSLSDLVSRFEHERAHLMREQAVCELSLAQTRQLMNRQIADERRRRLRAELSLMEEMLRLSERLHRYYGLLFDQGKTSFDVRVRAEQQAIEARQKVLRLRAELGESLLD
jgi:Outer membrane efflux protein